MMRSTIRTPEVARMLGVSQSTIREWCRDGAGPEHFRTPKGTFLFRREDVERWVETSKF
jgi:excisionase family DNA binding protein